MSFKEHLQFFVLMIPTMLLLVAAIITLAAPGAADSRAFETTGSIDLQARHEVAVADGEATPVHAVVVR